MRCPSQEVIGLSELTVCEFNHSLGAYVLDEVCNDSYALSTQTTVEEDSYRHHPAVSHWWSY